MAHTPDQRKVYLAANKGRIAAVNKAWRLKNKETVFAQKKAWRDANKLHVKAKIKDWSDRNPGKWREYTAARKALQLQATPAWADKGAMLAFYEEADFLTKVTGDPYHVDHIVPLQSDLVCGLHNHFNLQVLTAEENQSKSNRFWPDMP
jgi:hypothetical protein